MNRNLLIRSAQARGFTLVELIIVIVIIGILAAVAVPQFIGVRDNAREAALRANAASLGAAATAYFASNPSADEGCSALLTSGEMSLGSPAAVYWQQPNDEIEITGTGQTCAVDYVNQPLELENPVTFILPWTPAG